MKSEQSFTETPKTESEQLITLINEFLEVQVDSKGLLTNPSRIAHYRKLLEDNLPPRDMEAAEYQWRAELKLIKEASSESEYIKRAAHIIFTIHLLLKLILDDLKEKLPALHTIPKSMAMERHLRGLDLIDELRRKWSNELYGGLMSIPEFLKKFPGTKVTYEEEDGDFSLAPGAFEDFLALLDSIKLEDLRKCKNKDCKNWFMWKSELKKEKIYCDHLCGVNNYQRKKKEKDPDHYKKYMQKYRAKQKKKGKKRSRGKAKSGKI
jgi:hypothetical protein